MSSSQSPEVGVPGPLLESVLEGRRSALLRYVGYLGKGLLPSEDLVQEASLRALRAAQVPRTEPEIVAWIFRILRNLVVDEIRKAKRWRAFPITHQAGEEGPGGGPLLTIAPTARTRVSQKEAERILAEVLSELDEGSLDLVSLRFFGGLSTSEIAECRSLPVGTVCAKIFRATKRMRTSLESRGYAFSELEPME